MQSPPKTAVFESDLAPLLSAFVAEKQRFGFKYNSIEAYLKSFDTFLLGRDCKNFLGHVQIETTEVYARADAEMKRKALETANLDLPAESQTSWQKDQSLLSWLQSL